jgi:hypothetical protein
MSVRSSALRAFVLAGTALAALGLGACSELKFGV